MRALFTAEPGWGHLQPVLATAKQLQARGHTVLVATGRRYVAAARRVGVPATAAGIDWDLSHADDCFPALAGLDALAKTVALRDIFVGPAVPPMLDDLRRIAERFRPDVVVSETWELAGGVVAELQGVPSLTQSVVTLALPPTIATPTSPGAQLAARALAGLPETDAQLWARRQQILFGMPASWFLPGLEPGPNVHVVRPPVLTEAGGTHVPPWLDEPRSQPLVLATLGTVFWDGSQVLERLLEAVDGEPYDVLVALGSDADPTVLGPVPRNVHLERYVPFTDVLPRCSAVVTHGGFGTVAATLTAGLPMVVMPVGADQFATARQIERLGLGVVVTGADPLVIDLGAISGSFVNPRTLTAEEVRAGIRRVLGDGKIRTAAAAEREAIAAIPRDAAARVIEQAVAVGTGALREVEPA